MTGNGLDLGTPPAPTFADDRLMAEIDLGRRARLALRRRVDEGPNRREVVKRSSTQIRRACRRAGSIWLVLGNKTI